MMSRRDRQLFRALARAHRLTRRERRISKRVARFHGLFGRDGPASSAAAVFFRPSHWASYLRSGRKGFGRPAPREVEALAAKLFAAAAEEMPLEW